MCSTLSNIHKLFEQHKFIGKHGINYSIIFKILPEAPNFYTGRSEIYWFQTFYGAIKIKVENLAETYFVGKMRNRVI